MSPEIRRYECKECGYDEDRDINAAKNIAEWGYQELFGKKLGSERAYLDVVFGILSSDMISSTQLKEEIVAF